MDFRGIESCLEKSIAQRLEISTLMPEEETPHDHRWLAELVYADGRRLSASEPKRHLIAALIDLEHVCSGRRRQVLRTQHHDSLALDLLRNVHAVITITAGRGRYKLTVRDHLSRFPEVSVSAESVWLAIVEGVTATMASVAAAHQSKFVGH